MVTIFRSLPEITEPDIVTELAAITLMVDGTVARGPELLPGSLFHVPPQVAGFGFNVFANPLKAAGAAPPLSEFCFDHCDPQKVTCCPTAALASPITKRPLQGGDGKARNSGPPSP